jgi:hypothetical protein
VNKVLQSLNPSLWGTRADHTREQLGDLLTGCYGRLVQKNESLLEYLHRKNESDFWQRLNSIDWHTRLTPLDSGDLHDLLDKCNKDRLVQSQQRLSHAHLGALIDKGWLSGPCDLKVIYPCSGLVRDASNVCKLLTPLG